jgi:hypothetical protein
MEQYFLFILIFLINGAILGHHLLPSSVTHFRIIPLRIWVIQLTKMNLDTNIRRKRYIKKIKVIKIIENIEYLYKSQKVKTQ